jgi:signal transduction histidine kinase
LVNLVKNAAEAMPGGGRIYICLGEMSPRNQGSVERGENQPRDLDNANGATLALTVEDNGPGIPEEALEKVFVSGYTTRVREDAKNIGWPLSHRGLGLAIVRSMVEKAGGRIAAANRAQGGARFTLELPVGKQDQGPGTRGRELRAESR